MSTIHHEGIALPTFVPAPRKYDLRTSDGKFWRQFADLSEYETTTGSVVDERGIEREALHINRTVEVSVDEVQRYLLLALRHNWTARDKGIAVLVVIDEAVAVKSWDWNWTTTATTYSLDTDGWFGIETDTLAGYEALSKRGIPVDSVKEYSVLVERWEAQDRADAEARERHDTIKASFVPSHAYEVALFSATKFIDEGIEPSRGDKDTWHNHVHVAIEVEVLNLCKEFVDILGKTTHEVRGAFGDDGRFVDPVVIDETLAYATVVANRVGWGWSSNDHSSALLGEVLRRFTRVIQGRD